MKIPRKYLILTIVSCILTVATQLVYHYTPTFGDAAGYIDLAKQYSKFNFFEPSLTNAQYGASIGFVTYLVILGNIVSYNQYIIGIIQTILFCTSAFLLISKLEKYLDKNLTGLAILIVLVPEINFYNGFILTESFSYSTILLIFTVSLDMYMGKATLTKLFLLSLLLGIIILTRYEAVACVFAVLFLLFPKIKKKLILYTLIIISFPVILLSLNGVRNYKTFHVYKITAFNEGDALYGGNNENLDGSPHVFELHKNIFIPKNKIADLNEILAKPPLYSVPERDSFYRQLAIETWKKEPVQQLSVIPEKLAKYWLLPGIFDIYTNDTTKQRGLQIGKILSKKYFNNAWYAPYKHLFYMVIYWILLAIIIWGLFDIKKENRFQMAVAILLLFYLSYSIPFCALPRFHVAIFPLLLIAFTPLPLILKLNEIVHRIKSRYIR